MIKKILKNIPLIKKRDAKLQGPGQFDIIQSLIGDKILAVDVGANDGRTINSILERFKKAEVHSFEPTPQLYDILQREYSGNNNVFVYNTALSDKTGRLDFWTSKYSPANSILRPNIDIYRKHIGDSSKAVGIFNNSLQKILVDATTFYSWKQAYLPGCIIDLLKVDTQGYDYNVLLGAGDSLDQVKLILVELQFDSFY